MKPKVEHISEMTPSFAFTEFNFYKDYEESSKKSELGRFHALLPLREMVMRFGLINSVPRRKVGRKSYFSPEGKVASCSSSHMQDCLLPHDLM